MAVLRIGRGEDARCAAGWALRPDPIALGVEPVYRLLRSAPPFDSAEDCAMGPSGDYLDLCTVGVWAFQLHTYLDAVGARYGPVIRQRVEQVMVRVLDRDGDVGSRLARVLDLVRRAVKRFETQPVPGQADTRPPVETHLALGLLVELGALGGLPPAGAATPRGVVEDLEARLAEGARRVRALYCTDSVQAADLAERGVWARVAGLLTGRRLRPRRALRPPWRPRTF